MVPHPRAPLGARSLRPLNVPAPLQVQVDSQGRPRTVHRRGWPAPRAVAAIQDRWRIDDEWWRERQISRLYYELLLDEGMLLTVYHDLHRDEWYEQRG